MSYIDKNSNIVVSARMTNEGRKLLSLGLLTFDTFRLGDSNIDYTTLGSSYDITLENIIRAKADNPDVKTPILPTANATSSYVSIPKLNPVILETLIQAPKIGFFEYGTGTTIEYTAYTDTVCHVLQDDAIISLSGITGGTNVMVSQAVTYGSNTYEPKVGDLMMVKMSNDELVSTQSKSVVEINNPVPYLWYQVQALTGSLSANTLEVTLDRDFASFPSYVGSNYCWATFYPLGQSSQSTTYTGGTQNGLFSDGGFYSGGCIWNMNNVWSYPIVGTNYPGGTYESFDTYGSETYIGSKEYFGYTSEISATTYCDLIPSVSIIHYSNKDTCDNQSEQKYGQKFYVDTNLNESPKLIMPTLMWHKNYSGNTIGQIFSGSSSGVTKYVTLSGSNTTIGYRDLIDSYTNIVGRVYPELHMFTIHDQELVAALSYKSNRNWTLPTLVSNLGGSSNDGIIDGTQMLYLTYLLESSSGYTTGLHCQNVICTQFDTTCPQTVSQTINLTFPLGELPYMKVSGGTGWYADKFYVLAQRQQLGTLPDPTQWVLIDLTSEINGHTVGNRIDPINLESTTFNLTNSKFLGGTTYELNDFIKIPQSAEWDALQFGDERFFFGNVEATGVTDKFRTKFMFNVPPTMFNTSTNPTWGGSNQKVHINEVGVYDVNKELVAIGKMNLPIEMAPNATIIIEVSFDL